MDAVFFMELFVVIIAIAIGARWGGLGMGVAGGFGLGFLVFGFGMKPASPPISVMLIMAAVLTCVSVLQGSGGLDYLVGIAEKILRRNPRHITFVGPFICFCFTLFCGTGYVAFSVFPVIAEVAIGARVRPERPLTMSVIGAQAACTGSPMAAATAALIGFLAVKGVTPGQIFAVCIPAGFIAVAVGSLFMYKKGKELSEDPVFQEKLRTGDFKDVVAEEKEEVAVPAETKRAVWIFALCIAVVVFYGSFPSLLPSWESGGKVTKLNIPYMVQICMLFFACLIMIIGRVPSHKLANGSVFRAGMIGMVAVYGVAWLTSTFFNLYKPLFVTEFGHIFSNYPALFCLGFFFLSSVTLSQGATTAALVPVAMGLGIDPADIVWMWPACNGYFVIPAGGSIIACIAFDRTGTTSIGKYVFNHSYMLPGLVTTSSQVLAAFIISRFVF